MNTYKVGDQVLFSHCDGWLPATTLAFTKNSKGVEMVQLHIQGWLGDHWYPVSTIKLDDGAPVLSIRKMEHRRQSAPRGLKRAWVEFQVVTHRNKIVATFDTLRAARTAYPDATRTNSVPANEWSV